MSIPTSCTVLVIGGGPGGSYAASALARESIDTVLLEADTFPRYHIGESYLPSIRYFLDFVGLYDKFAKHGFNQKNGASFRFNNNPDAYTDFRATGGPQHHAWNVLRSEADNIMFKHAGECGAKIFDDVRVETIAFDTQNHDNGPTDINKTRPVSATWKTKSGTSGTIAFQYVVDASGRAGIVSTKYMKNRHFNSSLKNIAMWGYVKGAGVHGVGTRAEGDPYFHTLLDGTGWAWLIPLHNGLTSVGVVMQQSSQTAKKKDMGSPSSRDFFLESIKDAPGLYEHLKDAELVSEIKSASDYSYSAPTYASPYIRIVGDAGCFIDPLFSSGVHLALTSALSATATICASLRGEISEDAAVEWHSQKVREGYTRFLLVVTSAYGQLHGKEQAVLNDIGEKSFDRAFDMFRPIIQGTVDASGNLTKKEVDESVNFCLKVLQKVDSMKEIDQTEEKDRSGHSQPSVDMLIKSNQASDLKSFEGDVINGMTAHVKRGELGLLPA